LKIEDLTVAAESMLYWHAQRRSIEPAPGSAGGVFESTLARLGEQMDDDLWNHLHEISYRLTTIPAANMADVRAKIRLWRILAPESAFDEEEQTPDEALLCSIIADVERLGSP
jgi:hypothetical protein